MILSLVALVAFGAVPQAALQRHCARFASDPQDPWALAHGIAAFGPELRASDGRRAQEAIFDALRRSPAGELSFAREPHPDLFLKTLLRAGLPLTQTFQSPAGPVTLRELVRSAGRRFRPDGRWEDAAWTLEVLARSPSEHAFDVPALMDRALAALEDATAELGRGMDEGRPSVPKDKRGIYAHPCGGLHFVQALLVWARNPDVRTRWGKRLDRQVEILFYRLGSESAQYDAALASMPQYRALVLAQMLKFYGHFLETIRLLEALRWRFTDRHRAQVASARARLLDTAEALHRLGAIDAARDVAVLDGQTARDVGGDACHAVAGLAPPR